MTDHQDPHSALVLAAADDYLNGKPPSPRATELVPTGAVYECWLVTELMNLVQHPRWGTPAHRLWQRVMGKWVDSTPGAPAWRSW